MKVHRWKTITALAAAASLALAIGAAPSQAATTLVESTKVSAGLSASDLSKLPLTDRHLTKREKANLAVVLRAYHAGEGDVLDALGFMDLFAEDGVFNGIGGPFVASRYHSLVVSEEGWPSELEVTARAKEDGLVMALRHRRWPMHGVQFHPESILTHEGRRILRNFLELK